MAADTVSVEDIYERHQRIEGEEQQTAADMQQLQQGIISGNLTTGDELEDGLIALYGGDLLDSEARQKVFERYRRTNQKLAAAVGEPLLLVHHYTKPGRGCTGFGGTVESEEHTSLRLGLVSGEAVKFHMGVQPYATLPVEDFKGWSTDSSPQQGAHGIVIAGTMAQLQTVWWHDELLDLGRDLDEDIDTKFHGMVKKLSIHVRNSAIGDYLEQRIGQGEAIEVRKMAISLGIEPPPMRKAFTMTLERTARDLRDRWAEAWEKSEAGHRQVSEGDAELQAIEKQAQELGIEL